MALADLLLVVAFRLLVAHWIALIAAQAWLLGSIGAGKVFQQAAFCVPALAIALVGPGLARLLRRWAMRGLPSLGGRDRCIALFVSGCAGIAAWGITSNCALAANLAVSVSFGWTGEEFDGVEAASALLVDGAGAGLLAVLLPLLVRAFARDLGSRRARG